MQDASGKFLLPFNHDGEATAWASKALNAKAGAEIGANAGDKGAGMLAVMAIGGWDFIRESSTQSFNSLYDYSVYLHSEFNGMPGYEEALASAMAIYPDLENSHLKSVDRAYAEAKKEAQQIAKAERKRQTALAKEAKKAAS